MLTYHSACATCYACCYVSGSNSRVGVGTPDALTSRAGGWLCPGASNSNHAEHIMVHAIHARDSTQHTVTGTNLYKLSITDTRAHFLCALCCPVVTYLSAIFITNALYVCVWGGGVDWAAAALYRYDAAVRLMATVVLQLNS